MSVTLRYPGVRRGPRADFPAQRPARPARPPYRVGKSPTPRLLVPANMNSPGGLAPVIKLPPGISRVAVASALRRVLLRAIPLLGWGYTLYELLEMCWELQQVRAPGREGWVRFDECVGPTFLNYTNMSRIGYTCGQAGQDAPQTLPILPEHTSGYEWWRFVRTNGTTIKFTSRYRWGFPVQWQYVPKYPFPAIPWVPAVDLPGVVPLPNSPQPIPMPPPIRGPNSRPRSRDRDDPNNPPVKYPESPPVSGGTPTRPRPPGPGEKERKVAARDKVRQLLGWALSAYSEAGDLIDALYDALPDKLQSKLDRTPADKFSTLYRHWQDVDIAEAMMNIVENMIEDRHFGKFIGESQDLLEELGLDWASLRGAGSPTGR